MSDHYKLVRVPAGSQVVIYCREGERHNWRRVPVSWTDCTSAVEARWPDERGRLLTEAVEVLDARVAERDQ